MAYTVYTKAGTDAATVAQGAQTVSVKDSAYGAKGDGTTDDTAAINAALAAVSTGAVLLPRGTYIVSSNLLVQNKTDFRLVGNGAKIQVTGDGTADGGRGLQLLGTIAGVEITGLHIVGDGNSAHLHRGITNPSGVTITDLNIHHNIIEQVNVGISVNAELSGSIDGFSVCDNIVKDLNGIASGFGYGIHTAYAGNTVRGVIARNRVYRAQRHAIYVAHVGDLQVTDNLIYGHRSTLTTAQQADATDGRGKTRPAINIARSHNIRLSGNYFMDGYDAAVAIVPTPEGDSSVKLWDVAIVGNHFLRPQDSIPMLNIGDPAPNIAGVPTDILIAGNDFYADFSTLSGVNSIDAIRFNAGKNVKIKGNAIVIRGVNTTTAGINVYNQADTGTATYTDVVEISENSILLSTGNASTCRGIRLDSTVSTSIAKHKFRGNTSTGDAAANPLVLTAAATNPNLDFGQLSNYSATTDPTTASDMANGYGYGSRWVNTTTKVLYECVDPTTNAAVWNRLTADVQVYATAGSYTWTKPAWATTMQVVLVAAGGGGGSGRRGASGTAWSGGGGGAGGAFSNVTLPASACSSTETVGVGAGGNGGTAVTVDSTTGNAGGAGGASFFSSTSKVRATGGPGGAGGSTGTVQGGSASSGTAAGAAGGNGTIGAAGGGGGNGSQAAAGGGGGGGITAAPAFTAGGAGGSSNGINSSAAAAGTADGASGSAGASATANLPVGGAGGGGGASSIIGAGGTGAAGGSYGAGGGGGGASLNGNASGAGGKGGDGIVVVISR